MATFISNFISKWKYLYSVTDLGYYFSQIKTTASFNLSSSSMELNSASFRTLTLDYDRFRHGCPSQNSAVEFLICTWAATRREVNPITHVKVITLTVDAVQHTFLHCCTMCSLWELEDLFSSWNVTQFL